MKKILFMILFVLSVLLVIVLYITGAEIHRETGLTEDQVEIFSIKQ